MLSKLYNRFFYKDYPGGAVVPFWAITIISFFLIPLIGAAMVGCEDNNITEVPVLSKMMFSLVPIGIILYFIPLYDKIIRWVIGFVTTGDINKPHFIGGLIFGEKYRHERLTEGRYTYFLHERQGLFHRLGAINTLIVFPLQLMIWMLAFPAVIPYVVGVLSVIGLAIGLLLGARKTYTLSKKLTTHINDPDAHKK